MDYKEKMEFGARALEIQLSNEPERLTKDEISNLKLSTLSKCLERSKLSPRRILDTYLTWLEVHRTNRSINKQPSWETIQKQWIAAVKVRGFSQGDLIREAKIRQEQGHVPEGRAVLTEALIQRVFGMDSGSGKLPTSGSQFGIARSNNQSRPMENNARKRSASPWDEANEYDHRHHENGPNKYAKHSNSWESKDMSNSMSKNYNYICKRCSVKGHLLENCPTNLDPAYDTQAPSWYSCKGCHKIGDHYYTLCPENKNYDSLFQLRERSRKDGERKEQQRQRDLEATFGVPSRFKHKEVLRLKFEDDGTIADDADIVTDAKILTTSGGFNLSYSLKKMKVEPEDKMDLDRIELSVQPRDAKDSIGTSKPRLSRKEEQLERDAQLNKSQWNKVQPGQKYSPHALFLIKKGTLSTEIVNKRVSRPTALELWDRDDEECPRKKLKLRVEAKQNDSQDSSEGDVYFDASEGHKLQSSATSPLRAELDLTSMLPLDTSEPQVLRVAPLDLGVSEAEIRALYEHLGIEITAVSVWKPSYVHGSSAISAFVSLLNPARENSYHCCDQLGGNVVRGYQIRVSRVNTKEAFRHALEQFQDDVVGNKEWQEDPEYKQHHNEQHQLLQHLRLTAAFKQTSGSSARQGLANRPQSLAASPSSFESERKERDESGTLYETDVTMED